MIHQINLRNTILGEYTFCFSESAENSPNKGMYFDMFKDNEIVRMLCTKKQIIELMTENNTKDIQAILWLTNGMTPDKLYYMNDSQKQIIQYIFLPKFTTSQLV